MTTTTTKTEPRTSFILERDLPRDRALATMREINSTNNNRDAVVTTDWLNSDTDKAPRYMVVSQSARDEAVRRMNRS